MKGKFEQAVERLMLEGRDPIEISWIDMSYAEAVGETADLVTDMLVAAGYRPDPKTVGAIIPSLQDAYANGQKVGDTYIRLPQETWIRRGV